MNTLLVRNYIRCILAEARRQQAAAEEDAESALAAVQTARANKGDVAEGIVGATIVAKFLAGGKEITMNDVWAVLENLGKQINRNLSAEKKTTTVKKEVTYKLPSDVYATEKSGKENTIKLTIGLAQINFAALENKDYFDSIGGIIRAAIGYASSPPVMGIIKEIKKTKATNFVEVVASGLENQKETKVDILISVDGEPAEYGKISLKADSKQLGQTGKSWGSLPAVPDVSVPNQNSTEKAKKYTRGVVDLFRSLFGIEIDQALKTEYLDAWEQNTRAPVLAAVKAVYADAFAKISARLDGKPDELQDDLQDFLTTLAIGIRHEGALNDEGVFLLKLDNGSFKLLNFDNLVSLFEDDEKEIDIEVSWVPEDNLPKITISVGVDGVDYGPIISVRPKISPKNRADRLNPDYVVGEFRHYVEKEGGLERLIAVEFNEDDAVAEEAQEKQVASAPKQRRR